MKYNFESDSKALSIWREKESNKYFLNLENSKKKKYCIRKLVGVNDECIRDPKQIMTEIHSFYANLYDKDSCQQGDLSIDEFLKNVNTNMLTDGQQEYFEKKITTNEFYEALKSFEKNKTPWLNDGLTVEFYLGFWSLIEKCLVNALNFAHEHGQLSNSQKQAMIIRCWRRKTNIDVLLQIGDRSL